MPKHFKKEAQVGTLIFDEASIIDFAKYSNYSNILWVKNTAELLEYTRINNYTIKQKESNKPPFGSIYSLEPIELKTLKTYIKTMLANGVIWPFKCPTKAFILFNWKPERNFYLCVNYRGLNKLIIKNWYLLQLIGKLFD